MTGIFLTKDVQWAMATVDVVEYWNLVMKIFLGNGNGYGWWKKGNKKTCHTVRSPPCCPHVNKRQKEKTASLSHLHIKTSNKRYPEKIASLSHLHKKILFTKNNQKKLSHCPISTLLSPCSMLVPLRSCFHASIYMLLLLHVKNWNSQQHSCPHASFPMFLSKCFLWQVKNLQSQHPATVMGDDNWQW